MAILKVGDWVLVEDRGIGRVEMVTFQDGFSLVRFKASDPMASMVMKRYMTPIDPAFHKLLTDVHKESDDD